MTTPTGDSAELDAANVARALAEAEKFRNEARKYAAEAETQLAQARYAAQEANRAELQTIERTLMHKREMAIDRYAHVYRFTGLISDETVDYAIAEISIWDRMSPGCDMEIIFNSPGGAVNPGMDLFDFLQELRRKGHYITTHARGWAASMGGILVQAGDKRSMGAETYLLLHEISTLAMGKVGEIKDEVVFLDLMGNRILDIFAKRAAEAGRNLTASDPISREEIARRWERHDWWLDSAECLKRGIVDEVR